MTDMGPRDAPAILFLHGVGADRTSWAPQMERFADRFRCIALDMPGYLDAPPHDPRWTRADVAARFWRMLDQAGIESAHVVGLSLGGVLAVEMHRLAPERVRSLVLADSYAKHPDADVFIERGVAGSADMAAYAAARSKMLFGPAPAEGAVAGIEQAMAAIDPAAFRWACRLTWSPDHERYLAKIDRPTTVIVGSADRITPPTLSEEIARRIPGARLHVIEGAGHVSNLDQPDAFDELLAGHLERASTT